MLYYLCCIFMDSSELQFPFLGHLSMLASAVALEENVQQTVHYVHLEGIISLTSSRATVLAFAHYVSVQRCLILGCSESASDHFFQCHILLPSPSHSIYSSEEPVLTVDENLVDGVDTVIYCEAQYSAPDAAVLNNEQVPKLSLILDGTAIPTKDATNIRTKTKPEYKMITVVSLLTLVIDSLSCVKLAVFSQ